MIEIFEGRIGGGKTYTAIERIANVLAQGEVVCTNIRLKWDGLRAMIAKRARVEIEPDQVIQLGNDKISEFHRHVPWGDLRGSGKTRVLVVVDEAHLFFNARDWGKANRELLAFLTQSDKVSVDVIFISQSALNIDKQFMRLVLFIWRFRDLSKWHVPGLGIKYPFDQILQCQYDYDGNTLLNRWFRKKNTMVFNCYETAALLTEFPTLEGIANKRELKKVESKSMLKFVILAAIVAGIIGVFALRRQVSDIGHPTFAPAAGQAAAVSPAAAKTEKDKTKTLFDIYDEHFRAWSSEDHALKTDEGWYVVGEMSNKGLVTAVSDRRARIVQPDGRTGWVVARDYEPAPQQSKENPSPAPSPALAPPARVGTPPQASDDGGWFQHDDSFSRSEQARMKANLSAHVVGGQVVGGSPAGVQTGGPVK